MSEVLAMSFFLPMIAYITFSLFLRPIAPLGVLTFICFSSGITSGCCLLLVSVATVHIIFQRGMDPDNIAPPLVTTLGDVITMPIIFLCTMVALHLSSTVLLIANIAGVGLIGAFLFRTESSHQLIFWSTLSQRTPILLVCLALSSLAGLATEEYMLDVPAHFLLLLPLVNSQGGNAGSIFASRISSALVTGNLGHGGDQFTLAGARATILSRQRVVELVQVTISLWAVFLVIGGLLVLTSKELKEWTLFYLLSLLPVLLGIASWLAAITFSFLAVALRIHPDNLAIAFVCAFMDLFGTYSYAFLLFSFRLVS